MDCEQNQQNLPFVLISQQEPQEFKFHQRKLFTRTKKYFFYDLEAKLLSWVTKTPKIARLTSKGSIDSLSDFSCCEASHML